MKRLLALFLLLFALPCYADPIGQNAVTDGSGSVATSHYLNGYSGTTSYRYTISSILGLKTSVTGNAGTATALAANGSNCSSGYAALGVDASGAAESCWQVTPAAIGALATAGTAANSSQLETHAASYFATSDHNHSATYLGIAAKAADADTLDSHDTSYFQVALTNPLVAGTMSTGYFCTKNAGTNTIDCNTQLATPALGGTGVANGTNNTITFTGNYTLGLTLSNNTAVTLPTSGTLAVTSGALGTPSFTALNLPSSNADPGTTAGQVRHDSTVTNFTRGAVRWYDGTDIRQFVDLTAATAEGCGDGYSVTYNATNDNFQCTSIAGGSMTYPGAGIGVSTGSAWTTSLTAPSGALVGTTDTQTLSGKTLTIPLIANGATGGGYAEFREDTDNGTNYVRVKAPDTLGADYVATLPAATGTIALSSTAAYDASTWDASTLVPDQNAVRDYLESKLPSGADGSYGIVLTNNSAKSPTGSTDEIYFEANILKANQNGTESTVAIGPTAGQVSFTGPTAARAYALPDSAATILYSGGALGTPSGGTLTNATGLPIAGTTGWGTGVATALAVNVGSAGAPVLFNGAGGTPTSLNLTNAVTNSGTSLPGTCTVGALFLDTDADTNGSLYSCIATNTWKEVDDDGGAGGMATTDIDTGAEIAAIVTDETGAASGSPLLVFNVNPTLTGATLAGTLALAANNLTMTGSIAATGDRVTKGWFTDIESTNAPTVGGTSIFTSRAHTSPTITTGITPTSADGAALGSASAEFSDLYLAAGGVIYGENGQENTLTSSSTGWTANLNFVATGTISGYIPSVADSDAHTVTSAEAHGYMGWATGAGTWTLPAAAAGMNVCIYSTTAAAIVINPDDSDVIVLNGTALSAGDSITSASGAGDFICLVARDATNWHTMGRSGTWTDSN